MTPVTGRSIPRKAGVFGWAEAMNAGYYWELLEASEDDWFRLSGEERPGVLQEQPAGQPTRPPGGSAIPAPQQPAPADREPAVGKSWRVAIETEQSAAPAAVQSTAGQSSAAAE